MAGKGLRAPDPFNFQTPDQWPRWKKRFEQYLLASGFSKEIKVSQVNTLLYCIGLDSEDTLRSTGITDDELTEYSWIYNMTLARERHERRGKNALFRWSKLSMPSSFFDILICWTLANAVMVMLEKNSFLFQRHPDARYTTLAPTSYCISALQRCDEKVWRALQRPS